MSFCCTLGEGSLELTLYKTPAIICNLKIIGLQYIAMWAEDGGKFGFKDPDLDNRIDHDDDEQEIERTQPFQQGAASTPYQPGAPYHRGEQTEMSTMRHKQFGLRDTSYEETPLLGAEGEQRRLSVSLKSVFPKGSAINLETVYIKDQLHVKMKGVGKTLYNLFTKERGTGRQRLNPKLSREIKDSLGPMAQEVIDQENETIRTVRQNLIDAEKQLKEAETHTSEREKASQEVRELRQRIERTQAKIDAIQDEQRSNFESEAELRRQKHLQKNLQTDLENAKKEVAALEKQAKNKEQEQAKVHRLRASLAAKERERNTVEERLNQTKPLDDLKEQRQNEEDQAIIQDENALPSKKKAAEDRVPERNEEIARSQTQIAERERGRPLLERVKEIFKTHGVTLTAILIVAGTTIGAVIGVLTRGLKATGKALGNGLKDIAAKLGFLLPGLIGLLPVQSRRPSRRVSGRAHLAAYSCHGGLFVGTIS